MVISIVLLISKVTANKGVAEMATEFAVGEWLTEPEKCSKKHISP